MMAAGMPQDLATLNSRVGGLALGTRNALKDAAYFFNTYLNTLNGGGSANVSSYLQTTFGMSAADANAVWAGFNAMNTLNSVMLGQATVPTANNFLTSIEPLCGFY